MTRYYSIEHEWLEIDGGTAIVGITDHAQEQLGDVVFVELPDTGREIKKGEEVAVVESVKAASEVFAPLTGKVTASNQAIADNPALVNEAAESEAWFIKMTFADPSELEGLMDGDAYQAFLKTLV